MGIRTRIFFIVLSCLSIGLIIAFIVAERDLGTKLQTQIETELQKQGQILKENLGNISEYEDRNSLKDQIDKYSQAADSRITLISHDGKVLGDSDIAVNDLDGIDNHGSRPEVIDAFKDGMGWSRRYSDTVKKEMLYFAILDQSTKSPNIIRIAVPNIYFDEAFNSLNTSINLILAVAFIVAILASIIAGNYARDNLFDLEKAANLLVRGNLKKKTIKSLPTKRPDEIGSVARSISSISIDLKNQIGLIAKQRDQFGRVLDDLGQGIIVFSEDGIVTFSNDEALNILQINDIDDVHVDDIQIKPIQQLFSQASKKGKYALEFEHAIKDNDVKWILAQINKAKATKELILVLHDETQLRQMDSMRRDFIANLSHELNTPVSVIRANSETLLDGALDDKRTANRFTKAILHNSVRLSEMISRLIDLSRIEYGDQHFNIEKIDLKHEINHVLDGLKNLAKKKNIEFIFDYSGDVFVYADKEAIEQILNNLIENSIKYSNPDKKIEIKLRKTKDHTKVSILDDGVGVEEPERKLIFNRFYRTAKARAESDRGSGLGLAIVKHLVDQLGGDVGVMPRKKGGSRFWFTLKSVD